MKSKIIKEEKAITLISLMVTIIILIILAAVGISTGIDTINSSKLTKFNTEMKIMQLKANEWYDEYMNSSDEEKQKIIDRGESIVSGTGQSEVVKQANIVFTIEESGIIFDDKEEKREDYRYYSNAKLKELGIEGVEQDFFINVKNRTIVSYRGLSYKGEMYYTISQLPQIDIYNVNYQSNSGAPTFKAKVSVIDPLEKWKIEVYDIKYEDGYIDKWNVKYRLKGEQEWKVSRSLVFEVTKAGIYEIKIENNEVQSNDPPVEIAIEAKPLPNKPKLAQGMIPIKWENNKWVMCSENDPEWYEYVDQASGVDKTSKWANVMLSDGKYKAGSTETENAIKNKTPIAENELGSMFVWIPRYAYQIESLYHTSSTDSGGKINIEFLEGTKTYKTGENIVSGKLANKSGQGNWNEHPAFTFGDKILSGIWVAKFEASSTTTTPDTNYGGGNVTNLNVKVLPGKQSWRSISISNMFTNCINMNNIQNASIYGISTNDNEIDPHLMKNDEWGAVAYLTQSSYGRNGKQVIPNSNGWGNYKYIYTGYAGNGTSAGNLGAGTTAPTNVFYYNTPNGMLASTTGNITGIYDMSGGSWEYVAGYVNNGHLNLKNQKTLLEADTKYKNVYKAIKADGSEATAGDDDQTKNYEAMQSIYGDAVWETSNTATGTSSWHGDLSNCPRTGIPFFLRGGSYSYSNYSGLFGFNVNNGGGSSDGSFRPVLSV